MLKILITAPQSNTGKTSVTCGLLEMALRRGLDPCALKCGPDYIDPMFHKAVLGIDSHNLDIFLAGESRIRQLAQSYSIGHKAVICEGVMGYYDGVGMSSEASSWHVAVCSDFKSLLVIRPKGASLSLAAVIKGMAEFREDSRIAGVFLNDCSPSLYKSLAPMLEEETGIPVLGYLPHMEEAVFKSRHLGLYTAGEIKDLKERISIIADKMEETVDFDRILEIYKSEDCAEQEDCSEVVHDGPVIAVARDDAFNFCYSETLEAWQKEGAEIQYFSPMKDKQVPENTAALYLPGGYPEIYARELSENTSMLQSVRDCREAGMPIVAECGGFLYLGRSLEDSEGKIYNMAGVLEGDGRKQSRLVRFGYASIKAKEDSMLFEKGESVPVHEFHYWDSSENGEAFGAAKKYGSKTWECGFADMTMYAGFPHLYFAGDNKMAARFVEAAELYRRNR
ncbi:MAG: cobyrinate a,c-diamide synthase [Bacillota bacterium]|nr:cobyrinate a,c-diamide synthase [Bacillota bacterium]